MRIYTLNKMQLLAMLSLYKNSTIIRATTENVGKKKKQVFIPVKSRATKKASFSECFFI